MKLLTTIILFLILTSPVYSQNTSYPRQKIDLRGDLLPGVQKSISVKEIETIESQKDITIFDPYNKNVETTFSGIFLKDFIKLYGNKDFKILRVAAIDGYSVDIPKADISLGNLFLSYKDKAGFLTVDRMGPARIVAPMKGIINKDLLLKIGIYWVWQVKSLEFIK